MEEEKEEPKETDPNPIVLKSDRSKTIKETTSDVINKAQKEIPPEEHAEYEKISNHYILSLEKLLLVREQLL